MIKVGQKVEFNPFEGMRAYGATAIDVDVTGKVIYINEPHNWFEVEYKSLEGKQKTSFKFDEIGKAVRLIKN